MGWSWNAEREEKEYDIKGTVTISTKEYRDLINEVNDLRVAGQKEHEDWYREYNRAGSLEKKVKDYEQKIQKLNEFLDSVIPVAETEYSVREMYNSWRLGKMNEEEEECNE